MRAFVAVLAAGLTLAACGSSSDTKSGAPASGGAGATVTDTVSTAMAPVQKFAAAGAAVKAPAGKRVVAITCSSQGYGCVQGGIGVQEAAKVLGWNVTVADGKGDPATWNSAIQQAVTAKADGIVLLAVDPQLVAGALAKAKAAGIPVVSTFIPKLGSATVDGYASTDHAQGGKILADWIIKDSGGKAKVLMLDEKAFPELVKRNTALLDELKAACPGCSVADTVEFNIGTMAQQLAGAVTSSLQRHPDVGYVVAPFDSSGIFAAQGIRSAGKTGTVKMVGAEGDPNGIQGVQQGAQAVDLATVPPWGGWAAVDLLVRHMAGAPVENAVLPQRLFDKSNVPPGKGWTGDVDYKASYKELWGAVSDCALEIRGLSKAFGGARALAGVDLTLRRGEIHALLGENGAGKSTLIKILAGVVGRDAGTIVSDAGLAFVHQDLGLVDELSVAENIALELGYVRRRGLISFPATARRVAALLAEVGVDVSPDAIVGTLAQDQKVMVAVTRAVSAGAGAIVLDEVSSSLPAPEMARLAASLRAARRTGVAYIYVTHRLEEVFDLADRVTVLRDGRRVATAEVADVSHDELVSWILGDALEPAERSARPLGEVALRVDGPVSFDVRAGEILGVCGLIGSGSRDVARVLGGAASADCSATLNHQELPLGDPFALAQAGVAYVPGDRVREGAVFDLAVRENLFLARRPRRERAAAAELVRRFDVRPRDAVERPLSSLSGGNQQKVIFARALHAKPRLLVLDDPTAGVDVGSRLALHGFLRECAAEGAAVVLASTDFEEIAAVADRALVMRHGRVADELSRDRLTAERLARAAYGSSTSTEVTL